MSYAAITYKVKPGHDDEIAEIFSGFQRVSTPIIRDEAGEVVGRLLGSAVFIKDEFMVRVIHYEGSIAAVGRHMSKQAGVHNLEGKLQPYLAQERDTNSPENFQQYFRDSVMRCIAELTPENYPGATV